MEVRIYQAANGTWVVWDGFQKHRFNTEQEAILFYRRLVMSAEKTIQEILEQAAKNAQDMLLSVQQALWMVDANGLKAQLANADQTLPFGISDWTPQEWMERLTLVEAFLAWANTPLDPNNPDSTPLKAFYKR